MIPIQFLFLTFAISLAGFACIVAFPAARSPETVIGIPFWIIMVWGPSLAAIILSFQSGDLAELLRRAVTVSSVPLVTWALVVAPLLLLLAMRPFAQDETTPITFGLVAAVVGFNMILGPLGEELGWRGVLQERLNDHIGWLEASLLIGAIWLIWHLPLWTIDSPHAQIALPLFACHVMLYAVIIGAAYTISGGSILPAILIHLTFNVAANLAIFAGFRDPNAWFSLSLGPYFVLAVIACGIVFLRTGQSGLRWLQL
ncbi:CPBP family intramembrane metalloprotease [Cognatishimia sp. WU-CL00825]|uniref:CPBP family intramembrane glutamic endopeptidase n=1 Tax=Cognatishimia sp. WU-CL00825 TaxID=3127658 RepID=UPI00310A67F5